MHAETEAPGSGHGLVDPDHIRPALRRSQVSQLSGVPEQVPAPLEEEDEASGPEVNAVPDGQGRPGSNLFLTEAYLQGCAQHTLMYLLRPTRRQCQGPSTHKKYR